MEKPILEIRNVSKRYRLGGNALPYLSLRDTLSGAFSKSLSSKSSFLALDDISFDVQQGDTFGIIGKNGAGKSTLLKILSKITPPTKGTITSRGRVASLLEVGTGFHPELTGRENIFLNGSILGLTKKEITQKFDEIVDFSGVEEFLGTALKHYSSGMQLRLAFAVAAFLEPEIMVIDEVLAVGDAQFQKKCLGKMEEVSQSGRTVLFVSHNMGAVRRLCKKGIFLNEGKIALEGPIEDVIETYLSEDAADAGDRIADRSNYSVFNEAIAIQSLQHQAAGDSTVIDIELDTTETIEKTALVFTITDLLGNLIFKTSTNPIWSDRLITLIGKQQFRLTIEGLKLAAGTYFLGFSVTHPNLKSILSIERALLLDVPVTPFYDGSKSLYYKKDGYLLLKHHWEI